MSVTRACQVLHSLPAALEWKVETDNMTTLAFSSPLTFREELMLLWVGRGAQVLGLAMTN